MSTASSLASSGVTSSSGTGSGCRVDVGADPRTWPRRQRTYRPPAPDTIICSDDEDLDLPPARGFVRVSTASAGLEWRRRTRALAMALAPLPAAF